MHYVSVSCTHSTFHTCMCNFFRINFISPSFRYFVNKYFDCRVLAMVSLNTNFFCSNCIFLFFFFPLSHTSQRMSSKYYYRLRKFTSNVIEWKRFQIAFFYPPVIWKNSYKFGFFRKIVEEQCKKLVQRTQDCLFYSSISKNAIQTHHFQVSLSLLYVCFLCNFFRRLFCFYNWHVQSH